MLVDAGVGNHRRETDDGGPAAGQRDEPERLHARAVEDELCLVGAHREHGLGHLEHRAGQDVPGRHPYRAHSARQQQPYGGSTGERLDESLRCLGLGEVVVVVDHDQAVVRPRAEILGQHLREQNGFAFGILRDAEPLEHPCAGSWNDDRRRASQSTRNDGHVRRRRSSTEPPHDPAVPRSPLLEEDRLPVPRPCDEHPDARGRQVEGACEPRALDDPAPADRRLPWLVCHRDRADATPLPSVWKVAPAAGLGGPRVPAVSGSVGAGA